MPTDDTDIGFQLRDAADELFYGGLGSLLFGPLGFLGGMFIPQLLGEGGMFGAEPEPEAGPPPVAPTLDPSHVTGGMGVSPEIGQNLFAGMNPELWDPMQASLAQRTNINQQNMQQFQQWQNMMQQAFTHAARSLNQIPGAYARGNGG